MAWGALGLILVSGNLGDEQKLELVFEIFDFNHNGTVRLGLGLGLSTSTTTARCD